MKKLVIALDIEKNVIRLTPDSDFTKSDLLLCIETMSLEYMKQNGQPLPDLEYSKEEAEELEREFNSDES